MRILIDATTLLLPSAGVRNYLHYWILSLQEAVRGGLDRIQTYPPLIPLPQLVGHEKSVAGPVGTWLRLALVHFCNIRNNPAIDAFVSSADLFHASQHSANRPRWKRVTATAFDFSCWTRPQDHTAANVAATHRYGEVILKRSDGLIAISEHTRRDAVEILGIPEQRIRTIYPGVADRFFTTVPAEAVTVRAKYALDAPYFLFVGCIEPRKNVRQLISAYEQLPASVRSDVRLVLAGPFGWEAPDLRARLLGGDDLQYLGYVPEEDLPGLILGAAALLYPSNYEGFGLPVAQALATGTPVIVSNSSCLPEVVGDAGLVVDGTSTDALADAMRQILERPELARQLSQRGRSRAEAFRWEVCASQSMAFFREIAGSCSSG
jgi:glycosyltransferase involved in cell wall biosynthesis